ncbi:MAG TPA: MBL fold metallo-hydrolase [Caulobacteraceae bacterium]|nr:MBL fold metallo-hydrolase [Caulobacteraceae bacterium]
MSQAAHPCTGAYCEHPSHAAGAPRWAYEKGLHDLGGGAWAYLQPKGDWGWSNAGFVRDGEASLLVDTLFDANLTREMLGTIKDATGVCAADIDVVVNTHANGDHTFGNGLIENARIIASSASAEEMDEQPPDRLADMMTKAPEWGEMGEYLTRIFGPFDFAGAAPKAPTETFSGHAAVEVGDKTVDLYEVGPAHTKGDVIAHVVQDHVVFTGDILFIDGTPVMWAGPVGNWLKACDLIVDLNPRVIVPGHGPITDVAGVRRVQDYLRYIDREARARFDAGMGAAEAALDISLGDFAGWGDAERIAVNVATLYREYRGGPDPAGETNPFALMATLAKRGPRR